MSNVTVEIAGRRYTVACAEGEEGHVTRLAGEIDGRLQALGNLQGQSEARTLLFAALLLADELHEARSGKIPPPVRADDKDDTAAETLEILAGRLEMLAARLESGAANA